MTDTSTDGYVHSKAKLESAARKERLWLNYGGNDPSSSSSAAQILGAPRHGFGEASFTPPSRDRGEEREAQPSSSQWKEGFQDTGRDGEAIATNNQAQGSHSNAQGDNNEAQFEGLDELAAPAPYDEEAARREPHLEDTANKSNGYTQEKATQAISQQTPPSGSITELYTIAYLILFSLFGTLARLGLQALTFYPGAPVQTGLLWANVSGSLIMGFLSEDRKLFQEEWRGTHQHHHEQRGTSHLPQDQTEKEKAAAKSSHAKAKKTIPLYIGLATGFCGSFTSFSSFLRDAFFALANALPVPINHPSTTNPPSPISQTLNVPRNGGYSFMALLAVAITTIGLSLAALQVGAHLAVAVEKWMPALSLGFYRRVVEPVMVFLSLGLWLAAVVLAAVPPDRPGGSLGSARTWAHEHWRGDALFALVFAPPGCLLRFYVSKYLNPRIPSFPLGTFTVNIVGCVLEAVFIDLQRVPLGGRVGCQILQGMSDGFCGCLTTVSTWVAEIKGLRLRHAYLYAGVSFLVGLVAFVLITGSFMWTHGFPPLVCGS